MAETIKPKVEPESPKGFTKMQNTSPFTLQLSCGEVKPGDTVDFNQAEYSVLYSSLKGLS
jgi:hypothetical protein